MIRPQLCFKCLLEGGETNTSQRCERLSSSKRMFWYRSLCESDSPSGKVSKRLPLKSHSLGLWENRSKGLQLLTSSFTVWLLDHVSLFHCLVLLSLLLSPLSMLQHVHIFSWALKFWFFISSSLVISLTCCSTSCQSVFMSLFFKLAYWNKVIYKAQLLTAALFPIRWWTVFWGSHHRKKKLLWSWKLNIF